MLKTHPHEFMETFGAVTRKVRALAAERYAALGVGSTQGKFLRYIARHAPISQAELARGTVTDPTLTGRALEPLIKKGWVRRERSATDKRQYVVELTPTGARVCKQVDAARDIIAQRLVEALDARDIEDFTRIAEKILSALGT